MLSKKIIHNAIVRWVCQSKVSIGFFYLGLCMGVAVRAGMHWFVDYRFDLGDTRYYLDAAQNLFEHHVFSGDVNASPVPEMYRPPLYSFFVAFIKWIFGNDPFFVQLVQLILSLITAFLITRLTALFQPKAAPLVFGLMMLSPFEAVYAGAVLSETITAFLLVAAAYVILNFGGSKRWGIGGILLGLCVLTRDIYVPLIFLIASLWITLGDGSKRTRYFDATVLVISACLVVLPWTIRNYQLSERFVPISDGRLGLSLWMGTWATNGKFTEGDSSGQRAYPPQAFRDSTEKDLVESALMEGVKEGDRTLRHVAIKRIIDDPVAVLTVYFVRAPLLWIGTRFDVFHLNANYFPRGSNSYTAVKSILWGLNFLIVVFGIAGMIIVLRNRNQLLMLTLPILYTCLIYFPLNSFEIRYSQPAYPFLLIFTGIAMLRIANKFNLTK